MISDVFGPIRFSVDFMLFPYKELFCVANLYVLESD